MVCGSGGACRAWTGQPSGGLASQAQSGARAWRCWIVVYPPHCLVCRAGIQGERGLCAACWAGMPLIERPYCERLGTPFAQDLGRGLLSPQAIAHPPVFERARAVAAFDGAARSLVHLMKYGDRPEFAAVLGRWMARAGHELLADAEVLVPVPLHRRRPMAQAVQSGGSAGAGHRKDQRQARPARCT